MLLPLAILFGFMWLFVIRPERKRQKKRTEMLSAISKGDKVVTVGGMHGEVVRLEEKTVTVKVADNLRLKFDRSAIARPSSAEEGDPVSAEISTAPGG
jgi:preprotein translocase subunit YajC